MALMTWHGTVSFEKQPQMSTEKGYDVILPRTLAFTTDSEHQ